MRGEGHSCFARYVLRPAILVADRIFNLEHTKGQDRFFLTGLNGRKRML